MNGKPRKAAAGLAQQFRRPVAVLHVGLVHRDADRQAERVDHDMALAPGELLARVLV
jgi:hypothetical protein